jgi:hypothetical protein
MFPIWEQELLCFGFAKAGYVTDGKNRVLQFPFRLNP